MSRASDPGGTAAIARMLVELEVQLQRLYDMQAALEAAASQPPPSAQQQQANGSSGGGAAGTTSEGSVLRPVWGFFGGKSKSKKQQEAGADGFTPLKQQQPSYARLAGPVVVVVVTQRPEALDSALLQQLPVQLKLDLPAAEAREDLLMGWLMDREAAVNVQDVELLAR